MKNDLLVIEKNRKAICTSNLIAEVFEKLHKNVLQSIENLDCSKEFTELNFKLSKYKDSTGRTLPCYEITRDGFSFLVMGFTGSRAAIWKEKYIHAFNKLEEAISTRKILKDEYLPMTEAIKESRLVQGKELKHYHFSNEADMINRIITGYSAKKYKEENETDSVRDNLTPIEKLAMVDLQRSNSTYLEDGLGYEERKAKLEDRYQRRWLIKLTTENVLLTA